MPRPDPSLSDYFDDHARWESPATDELARYLHGKLGDLIAVGAEVNAVDLRAGQYVEIRYQATLEQAAGELGYSVDELTDVLDFQFDYDEERAHEIAEALTDLVQTSEGSPEVFRQAFLTARSKTPLAAAEMVDRYPEAAAAALAAEDLVELLASDRAEVRQRAALATRHLEGSPRRPGPPDAEQTKR